MWFSEEKDIVFKKPEDKVPISTATTPTTGNYPHQLSVTGRASKGFKAANCVLRNK